MTQSTSDGAAVRRPLRALAAVEIDALGDRELERISQEIEPCLRGVRSAPLPDLTWHPETRP